jgi:hypothetical protein
MDGKYSAHYNFVNPSYVCNIETINVSILWLDSRKKTFDDTPFDGLNPT